MLCSDEPVGLPWATALGFIRLMTHRSVLVTPMRAEAAAAHVRSWFAQRARIVPKTRTATNDRCAASITDRHRALTWAQRLKRVFAAPQGAFS